VNQSAPDAEVDPLPPPRSELTVGSRSWLLSNSELLDSESESDSDIGLGAAMNPAPRPPWLFNWYEA
jgi:hypothetical protein